MISERAVAHPSAAQSVASAAAGTIAGRREPDGELVAARTPGTNWRVSLHEAGHAVVGRALGQQVAGCTIVPSDDYSGLTWGPAHDRAAFSDDDVPDLASKVRPLMPHPGEPRSSAAEIFAHCHVRIVDLMAGMAAETLLHLEAEPWIAHSDIRQARALACIICSSEPAIDAYLDFGRAEAEALIEANREAVSAIANALMVPPHTLDAVQIDNIIAEAVSNRTQADEHARRARWRAVERSAARFRKFQLPGHRARAGAFLSARPCDDPLSIKPRPWGSQPPP